MRSNIAEVLKWTPDEMPILCKGSNPEATRNFAIQMAVGANQILVANYEVARSTPQLKNVDWDFVIIDEVHKLKGGANPQGSTAVWAAVRDVCKAARFIIMLSGTPIVNHPGKCGATCISSILRSSRPLPKVRQLRCSRECSAGVMAKPESLLIGSD